mgnify:CR=1 FL=1
MILLDLFLGFLKVGFFSFGGAYGSIPIIRDVVFRYGWMSDEEITYMIAVSESTPGPIMVNLATYVGSTKAGIIGAAIATIGVVIPSFVIILLVMVILKNLLNNKYVQAILSGFTSCVIGIIIATGLYMIISRVMNISSDMMTNVKSFIIVLVLLAVSFVYKKFAKQKISPIKLIILGGVLGIIFF